MTERLLQFTVPGDLFNAIDETSGFLTNVQNRLRTSLALGMFMFGEISLARAAELAEMPLIEFINVLEKLNIPSFIYTDEMLADDLQFIETHKGALFK